MADTEFVDVALLRIRRANRGVRDLLHPSTFKVTRTATSTAVKTMNRTREAVGYTHASREYTFELETPQPKAGLEVDWRQIWADKEVFDIIRELGDGGRRHTSRSCVVNEIEEGYNENGEATFRISGVCLSDRPD